MSELELFRYADADVRIVVDAGDPWFVATDVARALGYRMASDMTRALDEDEKGTRPVRTPSGEQSMAVVSEAGLYRAIVQRQTGRMADDRTAAAVKAFQRWVTREVLPAVRRTGSYSTASVQPAIPQTYAEALRLAADQADRIEEQVKELEQRAATIAALEPAADAWAEMVDAGGDLSLTAAAKALQSSGARVRAREFFAWLHAKRWIYRAGGAGDWMPYAEVLDRGYMTTRLVSDREQRTKPQARITVLGMEKLRSMLVAERGDAGQQSQTSLQLVVAR